MSKETWEPAVGEQVAVLTGSSWGRRIGKLDTVEKVGKRDIVLASGRRFNVETLWESGRPYGDKLTPANSDEVVALRHAAELQAARSEVRSAAERFAQSSSRQTALALVAAAQAYADMVGDDA